MSSVDVGTAFVRVIPDTTQFRALLQRQVDVAVAGVVANVPVVASAAAGNVGGNTAAASAVAATNLGQVEKASKGAATGLAAASTRSKILQGSIIGLSRITPVAVFGLGAYGSAAIGVGLALKTSISSAAEFEKQLNSFQAVTGVAADELDKVRQQALALGDDTSLAAISAGDAAVALTELAKAGLSVEDALGASRGVLELSGAASISAGEAAKIVATQLNAFKLEGTDAVRVADLLASASIAAQGEITDFAASFAQVAAVANQSGLSVEQTTAALTQLARAGIQGADAGTSLRTFLLRLTPTTKEATQFQEALGIELDKTRTIGAQLPEIIEQYKDALSALNPIQRTTALNQILGQDAIRAGSVLFSQSTGELERNIRALDDQGVAAQLNAAKAEGLAGAFAGLRSQLETAGIELGSLIDGPLERFVRGISDTIDKIGDLGSAIGDFAEAAGNIEIPVINVPFKVIFEDPFDLGVLEKPIDLLQKAPIPTNIPFLVNDLLNAFSVPETFGSVDLGTPGQANDQFGIGSFVADMEDKRQKEFERTFGAAARRNKDFKKKIQQAITDLIRQGLPGGTDDLTPGEAVVQTADSQRFQSAILEAQMAGNLQAELSANRVVENFLEAKLDLAKRGTASFFTIQKALAAAHANTVSVEREIESKQKSFNAEQEKIAKEGVEEAKRAAAAQEQLRQTILDIQTQRLSNRLAVALRTEGTDDERGVFGQQIALLKKQKQRAEAIANTAKQGSQAQADARKQIEVLNGQIIDIRTKIKNLGKDGSGGDGFSLQDLFQEAVNQFNTFGSNIAGRNGVLSPQDERAAFGQTAVKNAGEAIAAASLTQQERQTALLESINSKLIANPQGGIPVTGNRGRIGGLTAIEEADRLAANGVLN